MKKRLVRGCTWCAFHACPMKTINRAQWGYCLDRRWRPQKGCFWFPDSEPRYFHHSSLAGPPCQTLYKLLFDRCKEAWKTLPYGATPPTPRTPPPPTPHPLCSVFTAMFCVSNHGTECDTFTASVQKQLLRVAQWHNCRTRTAPGADR